MWTNLLASIPREISLQQRVLPLAAALVIALLTVELIRRRRLREEYAMLWICSSAILLVFAIFPRLLWHLSNLLGLYYLTTLALLAFGFLGLILLHLAVVLSRGSDDIRRMAQRIALLEEQLEQTRALQGGGRASPAESDGPTAE